MMSLFSSLLLPHFSPSPASPPSPSSLSPSLPSSYPRVCISVSLPEGVKVRLEVLATQELRDANHMHVQSLSHWAPANIGPYSQAYNVSSTV